MKESRDFRTNSSSPNSASDQIERESMRYQTIADIMTSGVLTISPENTLNEAAQLMGEKHIGSLIVIKYDTPVGIITEGALLNVVSKGIPLEMD